MKIIIHGRNLDISPALRTYTTNKLEKAVQNFTEIVKEADVHLSVARNPRVPMQTAEVTLFANGTIIRAQERSENLYASIDLVSNKLLRQLRRYKDRQTNHLHSQGKKVSMTKSSDGIIDETPIYGSLLEGKEAHLPNPGVRRKYFLMSPMSIEQARHQLDMIDHDFYLFRENKSKKLQVIYKRNHGGYGIIQERD